MKITILKLKRAQFEPRGRIGMTLIEVVVALAITGVTVGGMVTVYIFCMNSTSKDSLFIAANAKAMERIEQTRGAQWDTSASTVDKLVATNFPDKVVSLDVAGSGSGGTAATIKTEIVQVSSTPPIKRIRVDCIWQFRGGDFITNTIETLRAPD